MQLPLLTHQSSFLIGNIKQQKCLTNELIKVEYSSSFINLKTMYYKLFAFILFFAYATKNYSQTTCISGDCQNGYGTSVENDGRNWEGNFKEGRWNGYGILTYPDGQLFLGYWNNGVGDESKIFDSKSNPYNKFNKDGLPDGLWITFYITSHYSPYAEYPANPSHIKTIGRYRNGKKDGEWLYFSDASVIKKENYNNGIKDGQWITYWQDVYVGYNRIQYIENFKNGLQHGIYQEYSHFGNLLLLHCYYVNDQRDGEEIEYYDHSKWGGGEQTDPNQIIKSTKKYTRGTLNGESCFYREDGALVEKHIYEMGVIKHSYQF